MHSDQHHEMALQISQQIAASSAKLITTRAILLEIGNSLSKKRYRQFAGEALLLLTTDPTVEVTQINAKLFKRGLELFRSREDKEWGLVDCISFIVMQDRGLVEALTSDEHFEQAGFVALLRQ
jgi:predicted nucleic acid-binding protein